MNFPVDLSSPNKAEQQTLQIFYFTLAILTSKNFPTILKICDVCVTFSLTFLSASRAASYCCFVSRYVGEFGRNVMRRTQRTTKTRQETDSHRQLTTAPITLVHRTPMVTASWKALKFSNDRNKILYCYGFS